MVHGSLGCIMLSRIRAHSVTLANILAQDKGYLVPYLISPDETSCWIWLEKLTVSILCSSDATKDDEAIFRTVTLPNV